MQHLVTFISAEGREGQHITETLEDGVQFVERLRNTEGATEVKLFRLTPVPIEFKAYYRVEVGGAEVPASAPAATSTSTTATVQPLTAVPAPVEEPLNGDLPESAAANGRRLFSRG